eukprot:gene14149-18987_t
MSTSKLIREVADYCWSNNFLDVFRNFFTEHAEVFEDAPPMHSGEHNLDYYQLFQVYLKLYENSLEKYLKTVDLSITEFYKEVRETQNTTNDPYIETFIDCLVASCDYDSFYRVMAREGAKSKSKKALKMNPSTSAESKSESKSSERLSSKISDDDDGDKKSYK